MTEARTIQYCQMCGHQYEPAEIKPEGFHCSACGFSLYRNQVVAVGAVIVNETNDAILLAKRGREPAKGKWDVPGGFVDEKEECEDAVRRELQEELGVHTASLDLLGIYGPEPYAYQGFTRFVTSPYYLVHLVADEEPKAADDVESLQWFPLDTLPPTNELAFGVIEQALSDAKLILQSSVTL